MTFAVRLDRQFFLSLAHALRDLSPYSFVAAVGLGLGFFREVIVASHYGLNPDLDVYVAIMGFHLFLGVQIGNAHEMVLISQQQRTDSPSGPSHYIGTALAGLLVVNSCIAILTWVSFRWVVPVVFPGFSPTQVSMATSFMYCFLMTIAMSNIGGIFRGVLSASKVFLPGFLSGAIISLASILVVTLFSGAIGVWALPLGFALGNFGVLALLTFSLHRTFSLKAIVREIRWSGQVLALWGSIAVVLLGELFFQGIAMSERSFASALEPGTIAAFSYAAALVAIPGALVGGPLTTLLYPRLAQSLQTNRRAGTGMLLTYGLGLFTLGAAMAIGMWALSDTIVRLAFMRGQFNSDDVYRTARILSILALALPSIGPSRLLTYAFYSLSDYRTPMVKNLVQWVAVIAFAIVFVPRYGATGLATASVLALIGAELLTLAALLRRLSRI